MKDIVNSNQFEDNDDSKKEEEVRRNVQHTHNLELVRKVTSQGKD